MRYQRSAPIAYKPGQSLPSKSSSCGSCQVISRCPPCDPGVAACALPARRRPRAVACRRRRSADAPRLPLPQTYETSAPARSRRARGTKRSRAPAARAPHHRLHPQAAHIPLRQPAALHKQGAVSTGTAGFPTPTGVFSVIQKNRYHRSNIYGGAPMPFMQRITWSGVAHARGRPAGLSGLARLHPPDAPVRRPSCGA